MRLSLSALLCLGAANLLHAQFPMPSSPSQPAPQPTQQPTPAPSATGISLDGGGADPDAAGRLADRVWNTESDWLDLENGQMNWKGRTFDIGQSRAVRARFERYLALPSLDDDTRAYLELLVRVDDLLSQAQIAASMGPEGSDIEVNDHVFTAWQLLFEAGQYELDGGASLTIANQVYNIWRVRQETAQAERARQMIAEQREVYGQEMLRMRRSLDGRVSDLYDEARSEDQRAEADTRAAHLKSDSAAAIDLAQRAERYAALQARIAAMETQTEMMGLQAKLEFQSQLINLLVSRRFGHVQLGTAFYRFVFKGGHQDLQVGREQIREFMPASNFSPTVESIELVAREAEGDIRNGLQAVNSLFDEGEYYGALERMQETFVLGEFDPAVRQFPAERKRELLELYRKLRELKTVIDLKDFAKARTLVDELQTTAYDFPGSQLQSAIVSAQRLSNMALMSARQAVFTGQLDDAELYLQRATEMWPLNPAVESFSNEMAARADVSTRVTEIFDELYDAGNYRSIYTRAQNSLDFGGSLRQFPERYAKLEALVTRLSRLDVLIAQARELALQQNGPAAWELLMGAEELGADDPQLARAKAELAPQVAPFVAALNEASEAEASGALPRALHRYLEAQALYPASQQCRLGLERVSQQLMADLNPQPE